jgi:hypothetical protein
VGVGLSARNDESAGVAALRRGRHASAFRKSGPEPCFDVLDRATEAAVPELTGLDSGDRASLAGRRGSPEPRGAAKPRLRSIASYRWFGSVFHERASHDVYLLLEALGGDVAAFLGSAAPPSAFWRPRGLPSSVRPTDLAKGGTASTSLARLQRPIRRRPLRERCSPSRARHRTSRLLPWHSLPFSVRGAQSRRIGLRRDEVPPPSSPSLPGVSHALKGLVLCVRAAVFRSLTLFGFITLQSFDPSGSCPGSSPRAALPDVSPRAPSYRDR